MEKDKKIFFGIAIRNRDWCLKEYLKGLMSLDYPKDLISVYFFVNDSIDKTLDILKGFRKKFKKFYNSIEIEVQDFGMEEDNRSNTLNLRNHHTVLKNHVRERFLQSDCDYWLQVDSDSPCESDTLDKFLRHDKDVVFGTCNVNSASRGRSICNVLRATDKGKTAFRRVTFKELDQVPEGKLFKADWVGGIAFISKRVAEVCKYWNKRKFTDDNLGFCSDIQTELKSEVYVDPSIYLKHFMIKNEVY